MRMYQPQPQARFYCGVDLHARSMSTHVLDNCGDAGKPRTHAGLDSRGDPPCETVTSFDASASSRGSSSPL